MIRIETRLTLGELRTIVAREEADDRVADADVVRFDVDVENETAFDALNDAGHFNDWLPEREPTQPELRDLRDAIAEVRRGNIPMALVLFARLFESDAEYDVVERALREPPAARLIQ